MSKLFVGCRVRILHSVSLPELTGATGRIVGRSEGTPARTVGAGPGEWLVAPDAWGSALSPCGSYRFAPHSEQLEPILPEGAAPGTLSYTQLILLAAWAGSEVNA